MTQIGMPGGSVERPALFFRDAAEFRAWLEANYESATELWMGLRKKHVGPDRGLTWEDAVPEALCFGWIDSVSQGIDEDSRRQRWTPRKPSSVWSAVNIAHVERLTAEGKMLPAGIAVYEKRKPERSGYSYESAQALSDNQRTQLLADPGAAAFWDIATPSYRRTAENWVASAKREETREKRLLQLIDDCAHGRLITSQRYGKQPKWVERAGVAAAAAAQG